VRGWHESPDPDVGRFFFSGTVADKPIREKYIDKSVEKYWPKGSQNPIKYV